MWRKLVTYASRKIAICITAPASLKKRPAVSILLKKGSYGNQPSGPTPKLPLKAGVLA